MVLVFGLGVVSGQGRNAMLFRMWNKAKGPLLAILVLASIAYFDLSNFLPVSAHSDFRFQVVGEAIELSAVVGIFCLMGLLGR